MKNYTWIGIVAVVVIAVGIAYFVGKNSNYLTLPTNTAQTPPTTQAPTTTQTQPPVVSNTAPNPQKKLGNPSSNIDESKACAEQAAKIAKNFENVGAAMGAPVIPGNGSFQYQSHYNQSQEKCFYVSTDIGTYNGNGALDEALLNAYDNTTIASYFDEMSPTNTIVVEQCTINGVTGCTNKQFRAFLNTEMESTMY